MSVVGINFGSATSGAGFDVAGTVTSIMTNMRAPETAWAAQAAALTAQDTVLSSLGSDMSALSTALSALTSFDGVFSQKEGAVSDNSAIALTDATIEASAGTHTISVQHLATSSQQHSSAIAAGTTLNGSFTLQVGNGAAKTITLDSSNNTVKGLAAAINNLNAGVNATVIADSSGSHLSLSGSNSGAANELTVDTSNLQDANGNSISMTETQTATDAAYTVDGIPLMSASNTISGTLPGVTFQLLATTGSSSVSMQIANDTSGISNALTTFVSAYNKLASALSAQEGKDSSGNAEPLFGDQTLSLIQSQLSSALAFATGNTSSSSNLAQLGISVGSTGQLTLDTSALSSALTSNFAGITNFFQNAGDFGQYFSSTLNSLGASSGGSLALRLAQNSAEESTLANDKSNLEARLATYQSSLTAKLNAANQVLQSIPSQLKEVDQIYAAITGYQGNN